MIGIVTDSNAQIPPDLAARYGVEVVPLTIRSTACRTSRARSPTPTPSTRSSMATGARRCRRASRAPASSPTPTPVCRSSAVRSARSAAPTTIDEAARVMADVATLGAALEDLLRGHEQVLELVRYRIGPSVGCTPARGRPGRSSTRRRNPAGLPDVPPGVTTTVLELVGHLDLDSRAAFDEAVDGALAEGATWIAIDLAGLEFVDATGIGVLVGARNRAMGSGADLVVRGARGGVRRVLALTGVGAYLEGGSSMPPETASTIDSSR